MYPACGNGQISENIMGKLLKKDIHNTIRRMDNPETQSMLDTRYRSKNKTTHNTKK
jgi:hypothetical protein